MEYRELVGYENAAQGYAVRVSDRTWLCCFNSFAVQTDGTTRLPYFYAFLRQSGSSSLTALVANPFDTNGITLLSTDGEQMRFSYGGGRALGRRARGIRLGRRHPHPHRGLSMDAIIISVTGSLPRKEHS